MGCLPCPPHPYWSWSRARRGRLCWFNRLESHIIRSHAMESGHHPVATGLVGIDHVRSLLDASAAEDPRIGVDDATALCSCVLAVIHWGQNRLRRRICLQAVQKPESFHRNHRCKSGPDILAGAIGYAFAGGWWYSH